jgi:hypothetical protein
LFGALPVTWLDVRVTPSFAAKMPPPVVAAVLPLTWLETSRAMLPQW